MREDERWYIERVNGGWMGEKCGERGMGGYQFIIDASTTFRSSGFRPPPISARWFQ